MNFFDALSLFGGLALFLFGMNLLGSGLEKRAGHRLKALLGSMASTPLRGFILGVAATALMQSSSVTTVMVVGFVNSGIMVLSQAVPVIIGANLGAAITSWLLSLAGISGENFFVQMLKPSSFTPILALIGVILYCFLKKSKKRDTGLILLGFSVLMYGMEIMSGSVSGLRDAPQFSHIISVFSNPIIGVLVGIVVTVVIQSSSASIGILQALSMTGGITFSSAIPFVMGANTGTCISALLSCIGASKNAKRAAVIHLLFNIISTIVVLPLYYLVYYLFKMTFAGNPVNPVQIALISTVYKIVSIIILAPFAKYLEPLSCILVKDSEKDEQIQLLDERLFATPSVALTQCETVVCGMAELAIAGMQQAISVLSAYDEGAAEEVVQAEDRVDYYEDKLGSYLVKLSGQQLTKDDSMEVSKLLHLIGDFERISDHSVNVIASAEEIHTKNLELSDDVKSEISIISGAVSEILDLALASFRDEDMVSATKVEPLEQVVDTLKDRIRSNHITRLQSGDSTIELGFVLTDLITDFERVSDHCSNIAGCMLEMTNHNMAVHEYLHNFRHSGKVFDEYYDQFRGKYTIPESANG